MKKNTNAVKKTAKAKVTKKTTTKKTKVVSVLTSLINTIIAIVTVKDAIDKTSKAKTKDAKHTFKTKYFTVIAHYSQLNEREVTAKSREYLVQSMLLNNKSILQIYNAFVKTFNESKLNLKSETFEQYVIRRFRKYIVQECNHIKNLHIIKASFDK